MPRVRSDAAPEKSELPGFLRAKQLGAVMAP
jgi:hypothetical protein